MGGPGVARGRAVAGGPLLAEHPVVPDGTAVAGRRVVPDGAAIARRAVVADGTAVAGRHVVPDGTPVARRAVVPDGTAVAGRRVVADGTAVARRAIGAAVARGRVVPGRTPRWSGVFTSRASGRCFVAGRAGWAVLAGRAAVTDRRVVRRRGHRARLTVAGRLPAAALRRWRRRLLAADRARGAVTPLRGLSAFAPRTTRTLGW
ncbi:hypothetical protein ACIRSS_21575 [Amycolatopsis sp. NPDC101161]|uniref:hypothetical protein n=1 Tax=Amycolatopsis sp. NPDC101161 TaxID=3363940 RepID=UPI003815B159